MTSYFYKKLITFILNLFIWNFLGSYFIRNLEETLRFIFYQKLILYFCKKLRLAFFYKKCKKQVSFIRNRGMRGPRLESTWFGDRTATLIPRDAELYISLGLVCLFFIFYWFFIQFTIFWFVLDVLREYVFVRVRLFVWKSILLSGK